MFKAEWKAKVKPDKQGGEALTIDSSSNNRKPTRKPRFSKPFKGTCRNCGKIGHKAVDCRSKPQTNQGTNRSPSLQNRKSEKSQKPSGRNICCYNCGERGHISPNCPKPKKKMSAESGMFVGAVYLSESNNDQDTHEAVFCDDATGSSFSCFSSETDYPDTPRESE